MLNDSERLRTILISLNEVMPELMLKDALEHVSTIEAKLKSDLSHTSFIAGATVSLPNSLPKTIAYWIGSQPEIKEYILDSKKIQAIKEVRGLTRVGLKEAKEGVEYWAAFGSESP